MFNFIQFMYVNTLNLLVGFLLVNISIVPSLIK